VRLARPFSAALAAALLLGACTGGGAPTQTEDDSGAEAADDALAIAIASYDLAVGEDQRLLAGVFTPERELLAFGEVTFELGFLGEEPGGAAELPQRTTARFLPVPGMAPEGASNRPTLLVGTSGSGVYAAPVTFDEPGFWGLRVTAELADGSVREGNVTFSVLEEPQVPGVGDEAPASVNHTVEDVEAGRVEPTAVDSRAVEDGRIPDRHLHDSTIAQALEEGRPVVAIFSTPIYCVSRFCGPLVEVLADTATRYEDRADFVMVEVWEDFEEQRLNEAAAEWIQTEQGGNEPWVFLVGEDGRIEQRWDNVLDLDELESLLDRMPAIPPRATGSSEEDLAEDAEDAEDEDGADAGDGDGSDDG
jgi:hypothetical protein